jgi:hypothetical protein
MLQEEVLYKFGPDNKFYRVSQLKQMLTIRQELHNRVGGRHLSLYIIVRKILMLDTTGQP